MISNSITAPNMRCQVKSNLLMTFCLEYLTEAYLNLGADK